MIRRQPVSPVIKQSTLLPPLMLISMAIAACQLSPAGVATTRQPVISGSNSGADGNEDVVSSCSHSDSATTGVRD
jgi:hypothetical protein